MCQRCMRLSLDARSTPRVPRSQSDHERKCRQSCLQALQWQLAMSSLHRCVCQAECMVATLQGQAGQGPLSCRAPVLWPCSQCFKQLSGRNCACPRQACWTSQWLCSLAYCPMSSPPSNLRTVSPPQRLNHLQPHSQAPRALGAGPDPPHGDTSKYCMFTMQTSTPLSLATATRRTSAPLRTAAAPAAPNDDPVEAFHAPAKIPAPGCACHRCAQVPTPPRLRCAQSAAAAAIAGCAARLCNWRPQRERTRQACYSTAPVPRGSAATGSAGRPAGPRIISPTAPRT